MRSGIGDDDVEGAEHSAHLLEHLCDLALVRHIGATHDGLAAKLSDLVGDGMRLVVANAGLQRDAPFQEMTLRQWNTVINVNLTGQFLCARAAVREFLRRGRTCRARSARSSA